MATHTFFASLGFDSEDIYVIVNDGHLLVQLQTQGTTYTMKVAKLDCPKEDFTGHYERLCKEWSQGGSITKEEKDDVWFSSRISGNTHLIIQAMTEKGIRIPNPRAFDRHI